MTVSAVCLVVRTNAKAGHSAKHTLTVLRLKALARLPKP